MTKLWVALLGAAALLGLGDTRQAVQQFQQHGQEVIPQEPMPLEKDFGQEIQTPEAFKDQGQLQERWGWGGWGFPRFGFGHGFGFGKGFGKKGFRRHRRWDDDDGKKGRRHRRHKDDDDDDDGKKGRRRHRRHRRHGKKW